MGIEHAGYVGQIIKSDFQSRGIKASDPFVLDGRVCIILEFHGGETVMIEAFPVKQVKIQNEPKTTPRWKE